jgi:hypothetical protein
MHCRLCCNSIQLSFGFVVIGLSYISKNKNAREVGTVLVDMTATKSTTCSRFWLLFITVSDVFTHILLRSTASFMDQVALAEAAMQSFLQHRRDCGYAPGFRFGGKEYVYLRGWAAEVGTTTLTCPVLLSSVPILFAAATHHHELKTAGVSILESPWTVCPI